MSTRGSQFTANTPFGSSPAAPAHRRSGCTASRVDCFGRLAVRVASERIPRCASARAQHPENASFAMRSMKRSSPGSLPCLSGHTLRAYSGARRHVAALLSGLLSQSKFWAPAPESAARHLGAGPLAQASPMGDPANPGIQQRRLHHVSEPHHAHRIPRQGRHRPHHQQRQLHRPLACHQELVQGQEDRQIHRPHRVAPLHRLGQAWPSTRRPSRRARTYRSKANSGAASARTRRPARSSAFGKCAWLRSSSSTAPRRPARKSSRTMT